MLPLKNSSALPAAKKLPQASREPANSPQNYSKKYVQSTCNNTGERTIYENVYLTGKLTGKTARVVYSKHMELDDELQNKVAAYKVSQAALAPIKHAPLLFAVGITGAGKN